MAEVIGIQNLREPKSELERRGKIGEILSFISKFAFESTVFQSLGTSTGSRKRKESKDIKLLIEKYREDMKQHCKIVMAKISEQTIKAKIENLQKDMNDVSLQCKSSARCGEGLGAFEKKPKDGKELEDFVGKNKKRVFIRSRL